MGRTKDCRRHARIAHWILVPLLVIAIPATAFATGTAARTADEIRLRYSQLKPTYTGSAHSVAPSTVAPYAAGTLAPGYLQDGLNAINYARYLAGLADDVALDASYVNRAQHGAVLLAASTFSHTPPKPADMDDAFYNLGYGATSRSNIGAGYTTLWSFNNACMDDSDSSNIDRLGHRRWLLNPPLGKTGMGYASYRTDTFVFDWSRSPVPDYDKVLWPCEGYFPVEMFSKWTAWSITLNPAKYSWNADPHTVTLKRAGDGRTWTFTAADTDKSGEYYNFNTGGYGVANCFVFRPAPTDVGSYNVGDVFDVTLSGGVFTKDGKPATISYRTTFMSHLVAAPADTTPPVTTSNAVPSYIASATIKLTATDAGSGVAATYYKLDGVNKSGTTVSVGSVGVHTLEFWSVDKAGNVEAIDADNKVTFEVKAVPDTTPPVTKSSAVATYTGYATIKLTATDAGSGVAATYHKLDGGAQTAGTVVSVATTGTHTLEFWSVDKAGNVEVVDADNRATFTVLPGPPAKPKPVYRFYNRKKGVHFYTGSEAEKSDVKKRLADTYAYEGVGYTLNDAAPANATPLYRLYNKRTGVHFYTASVEEKHDVLRRLPDVYVYEGVAYNVSTDPYSGQPVHRFYNRKTGVHFYTASEQEKQDVLRTLGHVYTYEGCAFYLAP